MVVRHPRSIKLFIVFQQNYPSLFHQQHFLFKQALNELISWTFHSWTCEFHCELWSFKLDHTERKIASMFSGFVIQYRIVFQCHSKSYSRHLWTTNFLARFCLFHISLVGDNPTHGTQCQREGNILAYLGSSGSRSSNTTTAYCKCYQHIVYYMENCQLSRRMPRRQLRPNDNPSCFKYTKTSDTQRFVPE
jgi:hypothetical protein